MIHMYHMWYHNRAVFTANKHTDTELYVLVQRTDCDVSFRRDVCMFRRLGLYLRKHYGSGTGRIWRSDDQSCTGCELCLVECGPECSHDDDVSLICDYGKSQL